LHERTGVGSDLDAQLIERAIRSAETITGGIRQGQGSLFASLSNVRELKALFVNGEALAVSQHLPVWAEFSSYEGGQASHVN